MLEDFLNGVVRTQVLRIQPDTLSHKEREISNFFDGLQLKSRKKLLNN